MRSGGGAGGGDFSNTKIRRSHSTLNLAKNRSHVHGWGWGRESFVSTKHK